MANPLAIGLVEDNPGDARLIQEMLRQAVQGARRNGRHVGICGEAPATYPEVAEFLVREGIGSISINPQSLPRTLEVVAEAERRLAPAGRLARV